jgi:hypothetical protein
MKLPARTRRARWFARIAVLIVQGAFFFFFLRSGPVVEGDNSRYEEGGWALASGRGLALPYELSPDPDVRDWVCRRHPDACADGAYPSAQYPAGYQLFIAAIYSVAGRHLWPIVLVQLALLLGMFACAEAVAARHLNDAGYWFVVGVSATYPFLARQAGLVQSDLLHAALLLFSLTALLSMRPGWRRGITFGFLLGAATFTRTYSIVVIPFLFGWPRLRRAFEARRREWVVAFAVCILPFVIWTARNAYWFGRFIPFSTTGIGCHIYLNKVEAEVGSPYAPGNDKKIRDAISREGDPANYAWNKVMMKEGVAWMKENPGTMAVEVVKRVPLLWISRGKGGRGVSPMAPFLALYLGGLLLLGVFGIWLKRRDHRLNAVALAIVLYWGFLLQTPAEARRTLPLRLPMLVFAGAAVDEAVRSWRRRRERAVDSDVKTPGDVGRADADSAEEASA